MIYEKKRFKNKYFFLWLLSFTLNNYSSIKNRFKLLLICGASYKGIVYWRDYLEEQEKKGIKKVSMLWDDERRNKWIKLIYKKK